MSIAPAKDTPISPAKHFRRAVISSESGRTRLIQYSIAVVTLLLVLAPTVPIVYQSFIDRPLYDAGSIPTFQNYIDLVSNDRIGKALANTLILAFASTFIGQVIGVVCAILLGRTDIPGRRVFGIIVMAPLFISHLVLAFGWSMVYGPSGYVTMWVQSLTGSAPWQLYSLAGMSLVAGIAQAPLAMIYCLSSTALADGNLEDAARSCGAGGVRTLWSITLPLLQPAIIYSSVLNFTAALEMLSIPLLFGEPVRISFLSSLLYMEGIASPRPNYGLVATAAVVLLLIVSALVFLQGRLLRKARRFETVGGKASRRRQFRLGKAGWVAFAMLGVYAALFIILPVGILLLRSVVGLLTPLIPIWDLFTTDNYMKVFSTPSDIRALVNTLVVATVGGAAATALVSLIVIVAHKSQFRFRRQL
ncbi:MAG: transporter permease, partial [Massilia sp.]|nr:transporter permease [Massilia sp.]